MMEFNAQRKANVLYVFGGEKAQGAEIVIERLMCSTAQNFNNHLILSPGYFASDLLNEEKPYSIYLLDNLKKLNRSSTSKLKFYTKALSNYFTISYQVGRYIKKHQINIVHSNTLVPATYLIPLIVYNKLIFKPVRWFWSDHDLRCFSKLELRLSRLCLKLYDRTFLVSNALKAKYNIHSDKLTVLYNGLDTNIFKKDTQQRNRFRSKWEIGDEVVLGIAGTINPDKGHLELIQIFNQIALLFPGTRLLIAGNFASHFPKYAEEVELLIQSHPNIVHIGHIAETYEFYNGCDIIINNSNNERSESLGTTIYEAMACEKIVVAANTGGTPEIITNQRDGFLFKVDSKEDLYEKLCYVIKNITSLSELQIAARQKVIRKFNLINMAKEYMGYISAYIN